MARPRASLQTRLSGDDRQHDEGGHAIAVVNRLLRRLHRGPLAERRSRVEVAIEASHSFAKA